MSASTGSISETPFRFLAIVFVPGGLLTFGLFRLYEGASWLGWLDTGEPIYLISGFVGASIVMGLVLEALGSSLEAKIEELIFHETPRHRREHEQICSQYLNLGFEHPPLAVQHIEALDRRLKFYFTMSVSVSIVGALILYEAGRPRVYEFALLFEQYRFGVIAWAVTGFLLYVGWRGIEVRHQLRKSVLSTIADKPEPDDIVPTRVRTSAQDDA